MPLDMFLLLIAFLTPLAWSPGPANMTFAAMGARAGLSSIWPAIWGYHLATLIVTLAIGAGFGIIAALDPAILRAMQFAGAAYVLWLAWRIAHAGRTLTGGDSALIGFRDGAFLLLLNGKAYVILTLMFTQFPPLTLGLLVFISVAFTANNIAAMVGWALLGDRLLARFRNEAAARAINFGFAAVLCSVAIWMLL
jgi:threonine/homoserine/homoserine lactone efflux protein